MSCGQCETKQDGELVGKVTHYFDGIGVVVLELSSSLTVGDTIRIVGENIDFNQVVDSMEVDRQKISQAKSGDSVGLKVLQKAKEGCKVYKI